MTPTVSCFDTVQITFLKKGFSLPCRLLYVKVGFVEIALYLLSVKFGGNEITKERRLGNKSTKEVGIWSSKSLCFVFTSSSVDEISIFSARIIILI